MANSPYFWIALVFFNSFMAAVSHFNNWGSFTDMFIFWTTVAVIIGPICAAIKAD